MANVLSPRTRSEFYRRELVPVVPPLERFDAFQFTFPIRAFVKRKPALDPDGFAGRAIGENRIAMQARAGRVRPAAIERGPCSDDPSITFCRASQGVGITENFVVV